MTTYYYLNRNIGLGTNMHHISEKNLPDLWDGINTGQWLDHDPRQFPACVAAEHLVTLRYVPVCDSTNWPGWRIAIGHCNSCDHGVWTYLGVRKEGKRPN